MTAQDAPSTPLPVTDTVTIVLPRRSVQDALTDIVALEDEPGTLP
jgi:hypothetical protein